MLPSSSSLSNNCYEAKRQQNIAENQAKMAELMSGTNSICSQLGGKVPKTKVPRKRKRHQSEPTRRSQRQLQLQVKNGTCKSRSTVFNDGETVYVIADNSVAVGGKSSGKPVWKVFEVKIDKLHDDDDCSMAYFVKFTGFPNAILYQATELYEHKEQAEEFLRQNNLSY